jgi:hypothetical protein
MRHARDAILITVVEREVLHRTCWTAWHRLLVFCNQKSTARHGMPWSSTFNRCREHAMKYPRALIYETSAGVDDLPVQARQDDTSTGCTDRFEDLTKTFLRTLTGDREQTDTDTPTDGRRHNMRIASHRIHRARGSKMKPRYQ